MSYLRVHLGANPDVALWGDTPLPPLTPATSHAPALVVLKPKVPSQAASDDAKDKPSWFDQETLVTGVKNSVIAGGAGLMLVMAIIGRRR